MLSLSNHVAISLQYLWLLAENPCYTGEIAALRPQ